jgi:hypothetical protein
LGFKQWKLLGQDQQLYDGDRCSSADLLYELGGHTTKDNRQDIGSR